MEGREFVSDMDTDEKKVSTGLAEIGGQVGRDGNLTSGMIQKQTGQVRKK